VHESWRSTLGKKLAGGDEFSVFTPSDDTRGLGSAEVSSGAGAGTGGPSIVRVTLPHPVFANVFARGEFEEKFEA